MQYPLFCQVQFIQNSCDYPDKPINTFPEALEAFRTAMSYRFVQWLNHNMDVFTAYKASLGFVWG